MSSDGNVYSEIEYFFFADGPPFRAAVLIKYADWLLEPEQNNGTWVSDVLWPAINLDLQWIALHWSQSS
jgi:glucoamylase